MTTTLLCDRTTPITADIPTTVDHHLLEQPDEATPHWPIGLIVAIHSVAHPYGPNPEPRDMIYAAILGLVELSDPWRVTALGHAALAEHGWL
jgi:hypothetical protein